MDKINELLQKFLISSLCIPIAGVIALFSGDTLAISGLLQLGWEKAIEN